MMIEAHKIDSEIIKKEIEQFGHLHKAMDKLTVALFPFQERVYFSYGMVKAWESRQSEVDALKSRITFLEKSVLDYSRGINSK
jgi:hypothetical protein